jgi:UDP-2,3-diacylglucosamine pyrophosphatase LpxH
MARTRRIFISDVHLSSQALYDHPQKPAWYDPQVHAPRLLGFMEKYILAHQARIKDVILLGDIFNTWVCPARQSPPTYRQIFTANRAVVQKLKAIVKAGIGLFFIHGNHDFDVTAHDLIRAIPGIKPIKYYRTGRIHAEHGHRFDIFNKPDFITDPAHGRPIGYYISRLVTSIDGSGYGLLDLPTYLDDVIEAALTPQNIFSSIIEGLAERAGMKSNDKIKMPQQKHITIDALKQRFARLEHVYTKSELIRDLYGRRYLHGCADRICRKYDFNIVVLGHTHNALIDKDFFLVDDRIYANTGSWCKPNAYTVEIDKRSRSGEPIRVMLHQIDTSGGIAHTQQHRL